MLCSGLSSTLLLAAACFLTSSGLTRAETNTWRVMTCDGNNIQRLRCESGVIIVQSAEYRCDRGENHGRHDTLDIIKKRCDGMTECEINIKLLGSSDPQSCNYLDTIFTCFPAVHTVACEHSEAHLQCGKEQVIGVYWADYGRWDTTTCSYGRPPSQLQNVHCSQPTNIVADSCNGKNSCTIKASNSVFGDPCEGTFKYLEVAYTCQYHTVACEHTHANLQCGEGQVILVHWADYGRWDKTTCSYRRPPSELQNVHCSNPTNKVAESCNGKNSCTIQASNSVFGDPCGGTFKYLEVAYTCQFHTVACEHSEAHLQCEKGQVIVVDWATYGRRDKTTCSYKRPRSQIQNVHCSNPTNKVAESCNGKNSCSITASNSVFGDPCEGTFKYLEVVYMCQYERVGGARN